MSLKSLYQDYVSGGNGRNWQITKALLKDEVTSGVRGVYDLVRGNPGKGVLAGLGALTAAEAVSPAIMAAQEFSKPKSEITIEQLQRAFADRISFAGKSKVYARKAVESGHLCEGHYLHSGRRYNIDTRNRIYGGYDVDAYNSKSL